MASCAGGMGIATCCQGNAGSHLVERRLGSPPSPGASENMQVRSEPGIFHLDTNIPPDINYSGTSCPTLLCTAAWTAPEKAEGFKRWNRAAGDFCSE
eukprot:3057527-Karenia_brevis.AAC.1